MRTKLTKYINVSLFTCTSAPVSVTPNDILDAWQTHARTYSHILNAGISSAALNANAQAFVPPVLLYELLGWIILIYEVLIRNPWLLCKYLLWLL